MLQPRDFLFGPWRAVLVLGATQIIAWGLIYYTPVLIAPLIAAERGWSMTFTMGGFSGGLLIAGVCAPFVGRRIDRHGGHWVMPFGSLLGATGLVALVYATHPVLYLLAWAFLGAAMAAGLYDAAFATLGRIFGARARAPITALTLAGGLASTVSWPVTYLLLGSLGWRGTYLVYAAVLALVAAPLHAFALPRARADPNASVKGVTVTATPTLPTRGAAFLLVATAFAAYAFVPSGLSAHMLAIFDRLGLEARTVVMIGALFGPAQVLARLCEFVFARGIHPLFIARFALALLVTGFVVLWLIGLSAPVAAAFAMIYGVSNGLITIARGTVPLALFGPAGYGAVVGRIAGPSLIMQSLAPLALAYAIDRASDSAALAVVGAFVFIALICFAAVRRPAKFN